MLRNLYHELTRGISSARRVRPERKLNGRGAHIKAIPFAVFSVYNGTSVKNGWTKSGSTNSSSSSGKASTACKAKLHYKKWLYIFQILPFEHVYFCRQRSDLSTGRSRRPVNLDLPFWWKRHSAYDTWKAKIVTLNRKISNVFNPYQHNWTGKMFNKLLYKNGNAIRYSVRIGWRMITLFISLNSFQSSSLREEKN